MCLPIGGGAKQLVGSGTTRVNLGAQLFYNVVRPSDGTVWDLRLLAALMF